MEELRSSEVLDKEIRSDSIKKAEKILSKADESVKVFEAGVNDRVLKAKEDAEKVSREGLDLYEKNINASLPLEKQRYLVSYIHDSIIEAMNKYFSEITEEKRLLVIQSLAQRCKPALLNKKIEAFVVGFNLSVAEKMLKEVFGESLFSCTEGKKEIIYEEAVKGFERKEGVILKAKDGSVVCRLTLDEKIKEILSEKSCVLAETLFGGRLPE